MTVVKMLLTFLIVLFISTGCCDTKYQIITPKIPNIPEANITQCRFKQELNQTKCILTNYFNMKEERDNLRAVIEGIR